MIISWGILGAGTIADRQMAPAIKDASGHRLVAVMRRDSAKARAFALKHGAVQAYSTPQALLSDASIDAVYVATPPSLHAQNTVLAAEHGKHVLCEKPMALHTAQAQRMIDTCRANGVQLMVCHYQRFNARHQQIKAFLDSGVLGRVTAARVSFLSYFPPRLGDWHYDPQISGGGSLMDLGPHCLDLVRYLCGPATEVRALVDTLAEGSSVEDTATLLLRLEGGCQVAIMAHWSAANSCPEYLNRLEIYGTEGTIVAAPIHAKDSSGSLQLMTAGGVQDLAVPPGGPRPHVALLEAFGQALTNGQPVPVPGEEALAGLSVIEAAYLSARTGRAIRPVQTPCA
jgi:1,5-anhydro-D-fructose reductase (1,5-anhydro-D-mannitol-forming)